MEPDDSDTPAASPGSGSASASASATPSASGTELGLRLRRRPVPRKGHTKSRRGCFNCKRRKVKCQETRPECAHCIRIGLKCEYPDRRSRESPTELVLSSPPALSAPLQSTPTLFSADDMRFFHHFLVNAYPPLPILGDDVWRNVAALSHNFDYLMHAMLGLAASHLDLYGGSCSAQALTHRVKAIQSLNQALNTPPTSGAEADARFAALFALTFQASCMPEGMIEFVTMVKGCHILYQTSMQSLQSSLFESFTQEGYSDSVRRLIGAPPIVLDADQDITIQEFIRSLRALAPLCKSPLEVRFLAATERVVKMAQISAAEAFADITRQYSLINNASTEELASFLDPENFPAQLLLIHFILIEFAIGHIALGPIGYRFAFRRRTCIAWMEQLDAGLSDEYRTYAKWPMDFARKLAAL